MCPNCLGQSVSLSTTLQLVGAFLLVPPAVFLGVLLAVRRVMRRQFASALPSAPPSDGSGGDQSG